MELRALLWLTAGGSLVLFLLLMMLGRRKGRMEAVTAGSSEEMQSQAGYKGLWQQFLLRSYSLAVRMAWMRYLLMKVRARMSVMQMYEERTLRIQSMQMLYVLAGINAAILVGLLVMNPDVIFALTSIIVGAVIQGLLLELKVNRMEVMLLEGMLSLLSGVRHAYQRHGMAADAVEEAGEDAAEPIRRHARFIHDALTDSKPAEALEHYYETAPNRFLKAFAGISQLIMEFGDQNKGKGSLYLRGLGNLTGEIQLDVLRRKRLDYLLKGLSFIALLPVFFTRLVERWAISSFPLTEQFYLSKPGLLVKAGLLLIVLMSTLLLQKLKGEEEYAARHREDNLNWETKLYRLRGFRKVALCFIPLPGSRARVHLQQLLKDTNHSQSLELFQLRRILLFILCTALAVGGAFSMHWKSKQWIENEPPPGYSFFGSLSSQDREAAERAVAMDKQLLHSSAVRSEMDREQLKAEIMRTAIERSHKRSAPELEAEAASARIIDKLNRLDREYFKWWELPAAAGIGMAGYYMPYLMLLLKRRIRMMDRKNEVYQFQTMIYILRELDRISVEEILEWMYSYAVIFRQPLQKCLLHFSHGSEAALLELKEEAGLEEFRQLVDKLILANEKITIHAAFDDLESDMSFQFEQRRLHFEKSLDTKAELGRIFGFAPMYSLIFGYLVIPLIWMSFRQMDIYFEQIQHL
ncbi:hypothetical protein [Paenibacillus antibioticophila]|uniref:hypothetical protein n=1 Tax=Paenibacillus antibioticophila TaxID=1274374 RepID=UPI000677894D|nr:hypothetical protein [Paenibacillus antibioticophila]